MREHIDHPTSVGQRLREARTQARLSQRALSFPGCTAAYISRIERGERSPSLQILRELARRLNVSADFLATGAARPSGTELLVEAELAARLDDPETAQRLYARALDDSNSPQLAARAAAGLGQLAFRLGGYRRALPLLETAVAGGLLPPLEEAEAIACLARTRAFLGEPDEAVALLERAVETARAREDLPEVARFTLLLANILVDGGEVDRAREMLTRTVATAAELLDPVERARIYWSQSKSRHVEAGSCYARIALDVLIATEHAVSFARMVRLLAHIETRSGNTGRALRLLSRAESGLAPRGNTLDRAMLLVERARAHAALDELERATSLAGTARSLLGEAGQTDAGRGYALLADLYRDLDQPDPAIELYRLADHLLPHDDEDRVALYTAMADLLEAQGRPHEALTALKRALGSGPTAPPRQRKDPRARAFRGWS